MHLPFAIVTETCAIIVAEWGDVDKMEFSDELVALHAAIVSIAETVIGLCDGTTQWVSASEAIEGVLSAIGGR